MKVLYILTDSKYMYGASKSFRGLLSGLDDSFEYDVILGKSLTKNTAYNEARENFGGKMRNLYFMWVPRYRCIDYTITGIIPELSHVYNNAMAALFKYRIKRLIKKNKYDYVHLNATVLYPLVDDKAKYIIHNRDIVKEKYWLKKYMISKLKKVCGIINIDTTTANAINQLDVQFANSEIIPNPIDMSSVMSYDPKICAKDLGVDINHSCTIFAMIGQITEEKGSEFVIENFIEARIEDAVLLVVGDNTTAYARNIVKRFSNNKNVIFVGEQRDVLKVYRVADCILRGEDEFAIGRTHIEGLFSGLSIVIPGDETNITSIYNGEKYKDRVSFYSPRDKENFISKIKVVNKIDWDKRENESNVIEYNARYREYINKAIK